MPDAPRPPLITQLQQGGIRLSDLLVERVLELAGEGRHE